MQTTLFKARPPDPQRGRRFESERSEVTAGLHLSKQQKQGSWLQTYPPILSTHAFVARAGVGQKVEYRLSEVRNGLGKVRFNQKGNRDGGEGPRGTKVSPYWRFTV